MAPIVKGNPIEDAILELRKATLNLGSASARHQRAVAEFRELQSHMSDEAFSDLVEAVLHEETA